MFILAFIQVVLFCYSVIIEKVILKLDYILICLFPLDFIPPFILRLRETLCTRFYLFSVLPEIRTDKNPYYQESPFYIHLFGVFPCGLLALRNRVAPRPLLLSIVSRCRFTRHHLRPWGCVVSCFPHLATIPVPIYIKAFMSLRLVVWCFNMSKTSCVSFNTLQRYGE